MKWQETLKRAIDRLSLAEGIVNESWKHYETVNFGQEECEAYRGCLSQPRYGDGSRGLGEAEDEQTVGITALQQRNTSSHSVTASNLSSAFWALREEEVKGIEDKVGGG